MKKLDLSNYKIKTPEKKRTVMPWQEYALKVCEDFELTGQWKAMIFRYAKKNLCYLQGRVENAKEKFGEQGVKGKGNYLISLFRKKKPWEK